VVEFGSVEACYVPMEVCVSYVCNSLSVFLLQGGMIVVNRVTCAVIYVFAMCVN